MTTMFQSPSLRGSGLFGGQGGPLRWKSSVSIPFIAGQWSLQVAEARADVVQRVSIPFIAGQWSLPTTLEI